MFCPPRYDDGKDPIHPRQVGINRFKITKNLSNTFRQRVHKAKLKKSFYGKEERSIQQRWQRCPQVRSKKRRKCRAENQRPWLAFCCGNNGSQSVTSLPIEIVVKDGKRFHLYFYTFS